MANEEPDREFVERQRARLEELRAELVRVRDSSREDRRDLAEQQENFTQHDSGDMSYSLFTSEVDATVEEQVGRRLRYVERALRKIEEGPTASPTIPASPSLGTGSRRYRRPFAPSKSKGAIGRRTGTGAGRSRPVRGPVGCVRSADRDAPPGVEGEGRVDRQSPMPPRGYAAMPRRRVVERGFSLLVQDGRMGLGTARGRAPARNRSARRPRSGRS
jgi:RNA polymerase-binding transcription factor